jgi:hypothetical protein
MSDLSNAKWIGLRLSFAMYSFGGAGRGAGGAGAMAAGGGGGGVGATGAGAGGGAAGGGAGAGAGAACGAMATGRLAQAATNRSPTIIEARIERSINVRTVSPPLPFCYTTSVLLHLYGLSSLLNGTLV